MASKEQARKHGIDAEPKKAEMTKKVKPSEAERTNALDSLNTALSSNDTAVPSNDTAVPSNETTLSSDDTTLPSDNFAFPSDDIVAKDLELYKVLVGNNRKREQLLRVATD